MPTADFYAGSRLLLPISDLTGIQLDQVNFVATQVVALLLGYPFRKLLGPHQTSATSRHQFQLVSGLILTLFCFSYQTWHVVIQASLSLLVMRYVQHNMALINFVISLGYLCTFHLYRQYHDNGIYCLDITSPLMISTQRLSSLGYSLLDGRAKDKNKLTTNQRIQAVKRFPSVLEFYSYIFSFHGIILGPFSFYNDYISFMEGRNMTPSEEFQQSQIEDEKERVAVIDKQPTPSPDEAVNRKLLIAGINAVIMFTLMRYLDDDMQGESFANKSFLGKVLFIIALTSITRSRYYFAWFLGTAVNNNAGFGISGREKDGKRKWDLADNADIAKIELGTSLKVILDGWNVTTTLWLRHTVYERARFQNTLMVFAVSALWHGFYSGYYFTFVGGAVFILLGRKFRKGVRPMFQKSPQMSLLYDALTFTGAHISLAYLTFPFLTLSFAKTWHVYWSTYFFLHLTGALLFVVIPGGKSKSKSSAENKISKSENAESFQTKSKPE